MDWNSVASRRPSVVLWAPLLRAAEDVRPFPVQEPPARAALMRLRMVAKGLTPL